MQAQAINNILDPNELKIAKVLLHNKKITNDQFNKFLKERNRFERNGKRPLGDILVEMGYIQKNVVDQFFKEHNDLYLDFSKRLVQEGFLNQELLEKLMAHKDAKTNIVAALENLSIMTRENFINLYSKRVNALRLGDWLLIKKKIDNAKLEKALKYQSIHRLEDYLVYHKIVDENMIKKIKDKLDID
ncbi:hypothetical protein MNBD_NITROSPINAE02-1984 [hydrothermal vent metagenome]|uniref:Uncharacterized protein n=1 Tax=hydrothermal vent metagenome TaxID=652676 RepID=A0A3B1C2X2_9ZZZZ